MTLDEWNERYRAREEISRDPAQLLVDAAKGEPPGRALDLASGAGRNAIWLAQQGWKVVAIDGASEAIRILRSRDASVDARVMDLESEDRLPFDDQSFDLVAILYYLHRPLLAEARRLVRTGGLVVCAARMRGRYRIGPGELTLAFDGFEVLHSREGEIAELVARK